MVFGFSEIELTTITTIRIRATRRAITKRKTISIDKEPCSTNMRVYHVQEQICFQNAGVHNK